MVEDWQPTAVALEEIGPAISYVGFSMGAIFGFPTVAAMETIRGAVLIAGGIPDMIAYSIAFLEQHLATP